MNADDLLHSLRSTFGTETSLRSRRPKLYQLSLPVFMADGDGAQVYVRLREDGRVEVTDLGHTMMRLSYTRKDAEMTRTALGSLADRHGFQLREDAISALVAPNEVLGATLGLIQIESEAEASIKSVSRTRMKSDQFRALVLEVLSSAFKGHLEESYRAPDDVDGMYSVDARIAGSHASLLVAVTPNDLEAERAVASHLFLEDPRRHASRGNGKEFWIAIPRDVEDLQSRTRTRLMSRYMVPVPKYAEAPEQLVPKLQSLAA